MDNKSRRILLPLMLAKNDPWIKKQAVQMQNSLLQRQVPVKTYESGFYLEWLKLNYFNNGRLIDKLSAIFQWLYRWHALSTGDCHNLLVLKYKAPFNSLFLDQWRPVFRSWTALLSIYELFLERQLTTGRGISLHIFCQGAIHTDCVLVVPDFAFLLDTFHLSCDSRIQYFLGSGHIRLLDGREDQADETRSSI